MRTASGKQAELLSQVPGKRRRSALCLSRPCGILLAFATSFSVLAGPYVTEPSSIRWNDVSGVRWSDASGIRWSDASGVRWNETGGVRWSDASGLLSSEASGVRWSDASGVRWSDASGLQFGDLSTGNPADLDLAMLGALSALPDSSALDVIITYRSPPVPFDFVQLQSIGILGGTVFRQLPMVVVNATKDQIRALSQFSAIRSIYANRSLAIFDLGSRSLIGADEAQADPELLVGGLVPDGAGVTIAVLDTGIDATHPDLPMGSKVVQNVRLNPATGAQIGFTFPSFTEGLPNTDLLLGHGTFVSSVAAGSGAASGGLYRGVAPGAKLIGLAAGDLYILTMLEGFDYILDRRVQYGIKVVNCSWGTEGWFDPDDPINIATRALYDAGISVVFAAGNHGPSPDTLNPYAVAPWVIGVASVQKKGRLSDFSSRGIYEDLIYHPLLAAPGEGIIAASPVHLGGVYGVVGVADPSGGAVVPTQYTAYYSAASGTSFAAPHVAALIAMMLQTDPTLAPHQIRTILQRTSTPILTAERFEAGAGRLDAWAALTAVRDAGRPFGSHYSGWLDQRPFRIDHISPTISAGSYPAGGGILSLPLAIPGDASYWQIALAWGSLPGGNDLDLVVRDQAGHELARSASFNGASLFGRMEGTTLLGSIPDRLTLEVSSKTGGSAVDQSFSLHSETARAAPSGFTDTDALTQRDRDTIGRALSRRVLIGRADRFDPSAALSRAEFARAVALAGGAPQRIPASPTFSDVAPTDTNYSSIESISGARARTVLIDPSAERFCDRWPCPPAFEPQRGVTRLEFAVGLVRAEGRGIQAVARAGEKLDLLDAESIPWSLRGFVAIAIKDGLISAYGGPGYWSLKPDGPVPRLEAARRLMHLIDLVKGVPYPLEPAPDDPPDAVDAPAPSGWKTPVHPVRRTHP